MVNGGLLSENLGFYIWGGEGIFTKYGQLARAMVVSCPEVPDCFFSLSPHKKKEKGGLVTSSRIQS